MVNNIEQAIMLLYAFTSGKSLSHEDLIEIVKTKMADLQDYRNLSQQDVEEIVFKYEIQYGTKTYEPGISLTNRKEDDSWLYKKKNKMSESDHAFQQRYEHYLLLEHYGDEAKKYIISEAEKILSFCADPEGNEKRRGLVMGDVQSGKTSSYLALANIACDYGYRIVLILAGMTDSLRIQTQERVDEGVIGAVSSTIGNNDEINYVGVGKSALINENKYYAIPLTTDKKDFVVGSSANFTSNDLNKPQILVVKKNKAILESVKKWLKPGQANISSRNILIIDDECDNASINTKTDDDPSTINSLIRDIYNNFDCSTYVGYTATPFANIFINPEKKLGYDDLFPSDFIHRLVSSEESYFGINKTFRYDQSHLKLLYTNENDFIPPKHKSDYIVEALPDSLKNAICVFLLCNCIRTLRGDKTKHRSMMINISPYNKVQKELAYYVETYVNSLVDAISQYDKYSVDRFIKHRELNRIYNIYLSDDLFNSFTSQGEILNNKYSFDIIKNQLFDEISKFKIAIINNKFKGDQRFNYKNYKETGARVIAIGGFVLSRGLTLEGLMTSYYSRNASAYDTLLQMCRWFGYRPRYEDLCSIYMSQTNIDNFDAVIAAIDNIDTQLEIMNAQGAAPKDFGLMIMESPDTLETSLLITARNKMKNSTEIVRGLNYSGVDIDTSKLYSDTTRNNINIKEVENLCRLLNEKNIHIEKTNNGTRNMFRNVDNKIVADFIRKLAVPFENKKFDTENISSFIEKGEFYDKWDIVFATGQKEENIQNYSPIDELSIPPIKRSFAKEENEDIVRIAKNNNRLLEPGIFNAGLSDLQIEEAKQYAKERPSKKKRAKDPAPIAKDYLRVENRNPLLVILPIMLVQDEKGIKDSDYSDEKSRIIDIFTPKYLMGFGIGFAGREEKVLMKFRINKVKENEYRNRYIEEEDESYD